MDENENDENWKAHEEISPGNPQDGGLDFVIDHRVLNGWNQEDKEDEAGERVEEDIDPEFRLPRKFHVEEIKADVLIVSLG